MNELGIGVDAANLISSAIVAGKAGSPELRDALGKAGLPLAIATTAIDVGIAVHQGDSRGVAVAMGQLAGGIGGGVIGAGLGTPGGPLAVVTGFAGAVVGGVGGGMLAGASYDVTTALGDFIAKHANLSSKSPEFFDALAQEQPGILANADLQALRRSGMFTPQQLEIIHQKQQQLGNVELKIEGPLKDALKQDPLVPSLAPLNLHLDQQPSGGNRLQSSNTPEVPVIASAAILDAHARDAIEAIRLKSSAITPETPVNTPIVTPITVALNPQIDTAPTKDNLFAGLLNGINLSNRISVATDHGTVAAIVPQSQQRTTGAGLGA